MYRSSDASGGGNAPATAVVGLDELAVGSCARVVEVHGNAELRRRLLEMGFCNGAIVRAVRRAPLGDPVQFQVRGYNLSLRSEQARFVRVRIDGS